MGLGKFGRKIGILNIRIGNHDLGNMIYGLFIRVVPRSNNVILIELPWANMWVPLWHFAASSYISGLYEKETRILFETRIKKGMVVVDVGAHIGYFTLLFANLVGPTGHVYAFEPDSRYNVLLLKSLKFNSFNNITFEEKAISSTIDHSVLYSDPRGGGGRLLIPLPRFEKKLVETITLDQYFLEKGWVNVDMIKLDIEGGEEAALKGMKLLSLKNKNLMIMLEIAPNPIKLAGVKISNIATILSECGFNKGSVIGAKDAPFSIPDGLIQIYEALSSEEQINVLIEK